MPALTNAVELDWWQSARVGALEIVLTPVQHWSGRSLTDRMETLWGGYAIFAPDFQVFFAGDTAYSKDFADIHARFAQRHGEGRGFDLALIPIGAYEPRWFMGAQHVDPGRGGADPPRPLGRALDRHPLGNVPAHRRIARRAAAGARARGARRAASPTTPSR